MKSLLFDTLMRAMKLTVVRTSIIRVPELNKYLKQHSRHHHLENNKNEKIEVIQRHWHLQKEAESTDPRKFRARDAAHETFKEDQEDEANDDCDSINSVDSEDENKNDVLAPGGSYDDSSDIILADIRGEGQLDMQLQHT